MSELRFNELPIIPRSPNAMDNVAAFLMHWDSNLAFSPEADCICSPWGNLNSIGQTHTGSAPDLTPADELWPNMIEPGIRPLVLVLVHRFDFVTYDSCEGHFYPSTLRLQNATRRVGLLPRSCSEGDRAAILIQRAYRRVEPQFKRNKIGLKIFRSYLHSEKAPNDRYTVLDLDFTPYESCAPQAYFTNLNSVTALLIESLKRFPRYIHGT